MELYSHLQTEKSKEIKTLIHFAAQPDLSIQKTALQAIKDYMLICENALNQQILDDIASTLIARSLSEDEEIQIICGNAISYMVTHRLLFNNLKNSKSKKQDIFQQASMGSIHKRKASSKLDLVREFSQKSITKALQKSQSKMKIKLNIKPHQIMDRRKSSLEEILESKKSFQILDSIMYLSTSPNPEIRSIAFSTLCNLSILCSEKGNN